jgi:hypothetical protein
LTTESRKRSGSQSQEPSSKRRKIQSGTSAPQSQLPPILLLKEDALKARNAPTIDVAKLSSHAVLPDWRERFKPRIVSGRTRNLPVQQPRQMKENEHVVEDGEEEYDEEIQSIPMDVLKKALQDHIGSLGLNMAHVKEDMLLQIAERMIAGDDEGNELLDQLIEGIHGEDEEDAEEPADSFSQWVSGQVGSSKIPDGDHIQPKLDQDTAATKKDEDFINSNHIDSKLPSPVEMHSSNSTSSRGTKRRAESPSVSPRKKKSNRPPDPVSARG